jgi:hypothetical protein
MGAELGRKRRKCEDDHPRICPSVFELPQQGSHVAVHIGIARAQFLDQAQRAPFPVTGVVPGFSEALKLMARGSSYRVWIPPALADWYRQAARLIG